MLTTGLSIAALIAAAGSTDHADPMRYRMELKMKNVADLSAAGMGEMVTNISGTVWFQLTMSDTAGGRIALIAVDSVIYQADGQAAAQLPAGLGEGLRGSTVRAYVKDGKVEGNPEFSVPPNSNPVVTLVAPALTALFPGISPTESRTSWADTTSTDNTSEAGSSLVEAIANWKITGKEGDILVVDGTTNSTLSTSGSGPEMTGTIESKVGLKTPAGGPAREATITSEQAMSMLVPNMPAPIPMAVNTSVVLVTLR